MTTYKIMEDIESGKVSTEEGYKQMCGEITNNIRTWFCLHRRRLAEIKDSPDLVEEHKGTAEYLLEKWKEMLVTRYFEEEEESYYDWLDRQCEIDDDTSDSLTEQQDIPDDPDLPFY